MAGGSSSAVRLDLSFKNVAAVAANFVAADRVAVEAIREAVKTAGDECKALTQLFCPVDKGFMQASVKTVYGERGFTFETGWDAKDFTGSGLDFYPVYQEFGTRFMAAQPSLTPAYNEVKPKFQADVSRALAGALERARYRDG